MHTTSQSPSEMVNKRRSRSVQKVQGSHNQIALAHAIMTPVALPPLSQSMPMAFWGVLDDQMTEEQKYTEPRLTDRYFDMLVTPENGYL